MSQTMQDLRYAARTLATRPSFGLLSALCLGLAIGVNTTVPIAQTRPDFSGTWVLADAGVSSPCAGSFRASGSKPRSVIEEPRTARAGHDEHYSVFMSITNRYFTSPLSMRS